MLEGFLPPVLSHPTTTETAQDVEFIKLVYTQNELWDLGMLLCFPHKGWNLLKANLLWKHPVTHVNSVQSYASFKGEKSDTDSEVKSLS